TVEQNDGVEVSTSEDETKTMKPTETIDENAEEEITKMTVTVGGKNFSATLEENDAVTEFIQMMQENSVTIDMSDYSGFEKVGSLGRNLTTSNEQTTTTAGDIVLYNGNQIVIFYGSNSWSYTRLGKIDDLSGWEAALGSGDVSVTFSVN
ncbi:MAG: cyclophilin-like fold protein, partial [Eubacteriales bacterium]|nr:cyclophilin-like fold protein [Eubacteriales bacterium]